MDKTDREKNNDKFIDNIYGTEKEYKKNIISKIDDFFNKYTEELEDYIYIQDVKMLEDIPNGGYIRYINLNNELKWGGVLIKKIKNKDMNLLVLCNTNKNRFIVSFNKNYIFYKHHQTLADKTRKIFVTALDKYT